MIVQLVGAFVAIMIGIMLIPMISQQVQQIQESPTMNVTGSSMEWSNTMLDIMPTLFGIAIVAIAIWMVYNALKSAGLFGGGSDFGETSEDEEDDDNDEESDDDESQESDDDDEDSEEDEIKPPMKHSIKVTSSNTSDIQSKEELKKRHSTKVISTKITSGYSVDKYAIDNPQDIKLTMGEEEFKKSKFD